jgi:hypothetical protein
MATTTPDLHFADPLGRASGLRLTFQVSQVSNQSTWN